MPIPNTTIRVWDEPVDNAWVSVNRDIYVCRGVPRELLDITILHEYRHTQQDWARLHIPLGRAAMEIDAWNYVIRRVGFNQLTTEEKAHITVCLRETAASSDVPLDRILRRMAVFCTR